MRYLDNDERISRRIDTDLEYCANDAGFTDNLTDVAYGLATVFGANEESNWHWLLAMKDGTYAYATGWCDYTGWSCQSGGDIEFYPTLKEAIKAVPEKDDYADRRPRSIIKRQLSGTIPYGCES